MSQKFKHAAFKFDQVGINNKVMLKIIDGRGILLETVSHFRSESALISSIEFVKLAMNAIWGSSIGSKLDSYSFRCT